MPPILSTLTAAVRRSRLLRKNGINPFISHRNNVVKRGNFVQVRCFSSIAGFDCYSSENKFRHKIFGESVGYGLNTNQILQRRWFLGCGDGEEGSALSKVHEEKLVLG